MSIFSGWSTQDLTILKETLTGSREGLLLLLLFSAIFIGLIFILVRIVSHQVSNFYLRIQEEEGEEDEEEVGKVQDKSDAEDEHTDQ